MSDGVDPVVSSPASTSRKKFGKEVTYKDFVVIVLGSPGAGKTTFIHQLTDLPMKETSADDLEPDTTEIDYRWIQPTAWTKKHRLFLIDTPAVDGSFNYVLFRDLLVWIDTAVKRSIAFMGFIYVHDISQDKGTFKFIQLRDLFAPCVRKGIPHRLVLITTKWHKVAADASGELRQTTLEQKHWQSLLDDGAKVVKLTTIGSLEKDTVADILPGSTPPPGWKWLLFEAKMRMWRYIPG
ncbi:hypothetical protein BJ165DRAFT_1397391 [Panaeolus papilionaceus]|nr:hypothetical protein BJ165DRAFT_1397391 [Panaeolus papilionaceus]